MMGYLPIQDEAGMPNWRWPDELMAREQGFQAGQTLPTESGVVFFCMDGLSSRMKRT